MFKLNLKIALRNLWKYKGYTLINVGGLAIGLASCMVLLLYVAYEWNFDHQFTGYQRSYVIYNNMHTADKINSYAWTPSVMAEEIRAKMPEVAHVSKSAYPSEQLISYKEKGLKKNVVFADTAFLKIFNYKVLSGNSSRLLANSNVVVLTDRLAKSLFGNEDPIGKIVRFVGKESFKVEAVIEDVPRNSSIQFDYILPWQMFVKMNPWVERAGWGSNLCLTVVQLKDNRSFENVNAAMEGIYIRNHKELKSYALMHPLSKWHLFDKFENGKSVGGKIDTLKIFVLLAFCILLIACINFMNLSTARSEKRAKEVGVRKSIGAAKSALVSQFLLESVLLAFISMVLSFMLIEMSLPYFNGLLNVDINIDYYQWQFWGLLGCLTLCTGFVAGVYPAFYLSSFDPVKVLKGFILPGKGSLSVRKVLVVFQFVFAACLIVCTAVIYQQLNFIKNKPIGYDKQGLVELSIEGNLKDQSKSLLLRDQLLKSGAVSHVTFFSMSLSRGGNNTTAVNWPGKQVNEDVLFNFRNSYDGLTETLGTKLTMGREFSAQYADTAGIIVNETAVRIMGLKQPIGTVIELNDDTYTIIGVMKDFVMESPYHSVLPMLINKNAGGEGVMVMRLNPTQNVSTSMKTIETIFKGINPDFPMDARFLGDSFEEKFKDEKLLGILANWFGAFAIFISCLGLLGLALFMAEQRKKEISIRKVLGASTANILSLLNRDFIKLVAIANLIAFPLAYIIINRWLSAFEYRVAISILPFVIAIGLSLIIAVLTVSVQSFKVLKSNPVDALKYE